MKENDSGETKTAPPELRADDAAATPAMVAALYAELRKRAVRHLMRERGPCSLTPTVLVHEAYLKLASQRSPWTSRAQFLAVAATAMRQVLVDHARRRRRVRRGRGFERITLIDDIAIAHSARPLDLLDLDDALTRLAGVDRRAARVVEMRFFGGLSEAEAAEHLGVARRTVQQDWSYARAWLRRDLATRNRP